MNADQVEDVGWGMDDWTALNALAAATVADNAQLRRILPEAPDEPNAYLVETPKATGGGGTAFGFEVTATQAVTRVRVELKFESEQLHDLARIREVVQAAAMRVAYVEDAVLAFGKDVYKEATTVTKAEATAPGAGLFDIATATTKPAARTYSVTDALSAALRKVRSSGYTGGLRAAFGFEAWQDLVTDNPLSKNGGPERARFLLGGGASDMVGILPSATADHSVVVFAPDPGAIDLVWTQRPRLAHVSTAGGNLTLRIEEAFLLRIKNPSVIATYGKPQGDAKT